MSGALQAFDMQPRVRDFLLQAVEDGRASHAYVFVGPQGSGKRAAAWALAQSLVCEQGGCGACDACVRVARHTHPDVHEYAPESATGYLIAQIRSLLEDVCLAPIRAHHKVYIVQTADQLRANTANALLKTLEEPPANVTFILLAPSTESLLPTLVSRCQCVPFRVLAERDALQAIQHATGASAQKSRMAWAVAGGTSNAIEFLKSSARLDIRRVMLRALDGLLHDDEADILQVVQELLTSIKAPLADVKSTQKALLEHDSDYLSRGALKQIEDRNRRELSLRERSGIMEALASARSLMRDVLLSHESVSAELVNEDAADIVLRLQQQSTVRGVLRALEAIMRAERRIERNITPQLTLEVMLFDIRKALLCP